jgi:23S rRNA (uridine2552-2'-O)-methyltransferase
VLDLGAAPGSWSMYVSKRIGDKGHLLAVDVSPITASLGANVKVVQGDALSLANDELAAWAPYDVVLSDMAPSTSGSRIADQSRSFELFMRALEVAKALLAPGGAFVGKIFMSDDFKLARDAVRLAFDEVRVIRPEGTRSTSFETFVVGLGRLA